MFPAPMVGGGLFCKDANVTGCFGIARNPSRHSVWRVGSWLSGVFVLMLGLALALGLAPLAHAAMAPAADATMAELPDTEASLPPPASPSASGTSASPLIEREQSRLAAWQQQLAEVEAQTADLAQRQRVVERQLQRLRDTEASMLEQIRVLDGSVLLSRVLQELQASLPQVQLQSGLSDDIANWRLQQFDLAPSRRLPAGVDATTARLLAESAEAAASPPSAAERAALHAVLTTQYDTLVALGDALGALVQQAIDLQVAQTELQQLANRVRATIDEQLFWLPSQPVMNWAWIRSVPTGVQQQLAAVSWTSGWQEFWTGLRERPLLFLPVLLLAGGLLARRGWLTVRLRRLNEAVGDPQRDSHWHTPLAVLLNVLLALPGTLLLALAGYALQLDARGQNVALGAALSEMAIVWLVFYTAQRLLRPDGVAERHFGWPSLANAALRRRLVALGVVVLGMVGVVTVAEFHSAVLIDDYIGNLVVLAGYLVMAWLMASLLTDSVHQQEVSVTRLMLGVILALGPLLLVVGVVAGYYYTAVHLTDRLVDTLYVLIGWRILEAVVLRGIAVARNRMAEQQASEPGQIITTGPDGTVSIETEQQHLHELSAQSIRLVRLGLLALLLTVLYSVWADLIGVFSYLDNVVLYEYTSGSGDAETLVPISLRDVLSALLIAVVAIVLARNLPGLLEVLVLSRLKLAQGSNYAITTLLSYILAATGFLATLSSLGVSWDKLQWLVAALSVGLGFGLQEIFANFVSGLIILFERPMRIGDVVTVGNLSGTVSRIHIRATTIVDFERKEIIVPNKTFVTDQLINWTLSDTVTRVTATVGVAYGSDVEKVRKLLLQVAHDNPRVLDDPQPAVWFLSFGASTLDHELRVHVCSLADRLAALDELNRAIDRVFAEQGIEIAFNQMDVHVRSIDGKEARLETFVHTPSEAPATDHESFKPGSPSEASS